MRPPSRRRIFGLFAGVGAAAAGIGALGRRESAFEWRGSALGGEARIVVDHPDRATAQRAAERARAEIDRLEDEFSLFRPDSALSRLNRSGHIAAPSLDLRRLVETSLRLARLSDGLFDVSIQPLWQAIAATLHGRADGSDVERAKRLVDWRRIRLDERGLTLEKPEMALTFNGIAQGYIADRVAAVMRGEGLEHVLIDTGELRATGPRRSLAPWRVGLDPGLAFDLVDGAAATSSGGASPMVAGGRLNHLMDPRTATSPPPQRRVTVLAEDAMTADALATVLCLAPAGEAPRLLREGGGRGAIVRETDGAIRRVGV
jgi:thiamine biosynthesis lipoprotein